MRVQIFSCVLTTASGVRPGSFLKRHQAKQSVFKKLKMKSWYLLSNFHSAVFTQAAERKSPLTLRVEECIFARGMHLLTSTAYMNGHIKNNCCYWCAVLFDLVLSRYQVIARPISPIPISIPILSTYKSSLFTFM